MLGGVLLLFVVLGVFVSVQVEDIHRSVQQVREEQRESDVSRELAHRLRDLEERLAHPRSPQEAGVVLARAGECRELVRTLRAGPTGIDPSDAEHQSDEDRLFAEVELQLALFCEPAGTEPREPERALTAARRAAESLNREMHEEERESASQLFSTARRMRSAVLWTTGATLLLLVGVALLVRRAVLEPVRELRRGAARLAGRDLTHRVEVRSEDEIGELAREFNRMAEELERAHVDLELRVQERTKEFLRAARMAGLGNMAAGIAHEINNPLASIAACAEGLERKLRKGTLERDRELEYLGIIAKEAYRAHEITSRLLEFARSEPGPAVSFSLPALLREIVVLLEHRTSARGVRLDIRCGADVPAIVGDPSECKQVLLNLIHNAIDASPEGEAIRVECRRTEREIVLEVEDRGAGIAPEHVERIFDPFFTTKAPGKGTGLGLAIVHRIVEQKGGSVEVEARAPGTCFRVRLPIHAEVPA